MSQLYAYINIHTHTKVHTHVYQEYVSNCAQHV